MKVLVTGSAGHLGEALVRILQAQGHEVVSMDIVATPFTTMVASITDAAAVKTIMQGVEAVLHPATLHKPHVGTHSKQQFIDVNITGTLNLLEAAVEAGVRSFVFTSTTSVFGDALVPPAHEPAAWITEAVRPEPKNIYGVTKAAAEDLCQLFYRNHGLPCLVLRTSRFFPEADDSKAARDAFEDDNLKVNEFLYRRVAIEDVVTAHLRAMEKAPAIGSGKYIISATTPFTQADLAQVRSDAPAVLAGIYPGFRAGYAARGWKLHSSIDRVYVNEKASKELDWQPQYDFAYLMANNFAWRGPLAAVIGAKGYHDEVFEHGPYPVH